LLSELGVRPPANPFGSVKLALRLGSWQGREESNVALNFTDPELSENPCPDSRGRSKDFGDVPLSLKMYQEVHVQKTSHVETHTSKR